MSFSGHEVTASVLPVHAIGVTRYDLHQGERFDMHVHRDDHQLVWAPSGVLTVEIESSYWVLPPTLALWVPAGTPHATSATRPSVMQGVYLSGHRCPVKWRRPTVITVEVLLRDLILHLDRSDLGGPARARAEAVVFDLLQPVSVSTIDVALPDDTRARAVATGLVANPADDRSLDEWGRDVGASVRTLSRLFVAETGINFAQWRTQARLRAALVHLAAGTPISAVSRLVGYRTPSAFVAAFRRVTGQTPGAYFAAAGG